MQQLQVEQGGLTGGPPHEDSHTAKAQTSANVDSGVVPEGSYPFSDVFDIHHQHVHHMHKLQGPDHNVTTYICTSRGRVGVALYMTLNTFITTYHRNNHRHYSTDVSQ